MKWKAVKAKDLKEGQIVSDVSPVRRDGGRFVVVEVDPEEDDLWLRPQGDCSYLTMLHPKTKEHLPVFTLRSTWYVKPETT